MLLNNAASISLKTTLSFACQGPRKLFILTIHLIRHMRILHRQARRHSLGGYSHPSYCLALAPRGIMRCSSSSQLLHWALGTADEDPVAHTNITCTVYGTVIHARLASQQVLTGQHFLPPCTGRSARIDNERVRGVRSHKTRQLDMRREDELLPVVFLAGAAG